MTFALLPAAGESSRMGRSKLALPLGGSTVLQHVIRALHQGGVDHVLVVVGPHVPELVPLARLGGAETLLLPEKTPYMRVTVEKGLTWTEERYECKPADPWLLVPADHPTLNADVVAALLHAYQPRSPHTIIIPTYQGKRGHPCSMAWKHVAGIRALPPDVGINTYLRQHREETQELPLESADILLDLDTPEEYERLLERYR
jgi:CTP:molybdopterin cytidylyltransferase MocA